MREYSDMDTHDNENLNKYNEELLNSFVDGELNLREQTEVKRLMKNDSEIQLRVQKLQKCKMLISSMPKSKAPDSILGGVAASLIGKALLAEKTPVTNIKTRQGNLFLRKVVSTAAMLSLAAVLMMVIYIILSPINPDSRPVVNDNQTTVRRENIQTISNIPATFFSGRLELKVANLIAVDSFLNRAIEDSGMSDSVKPILDKDVRIYSMDCSKNELEMLLYELEGIWNEFESTKLHVETETFSRPITVETVNTKQIAEITNQDSYQKIIEKAKDYAVLNGIASNLPANEIMTVLDNAGNGLVSAPLRIPKPLLTGPRLNDKKPADQAGNEKNIHLMIVLNR